MAGTNPRNGRLPIFHHFGGLTGNINWNYVIILLTFVYIFAVSMSTSAIFLEAFTFHKYDKPAHIASFLLTAIIEPVLYHPLTVYWGIRGNIDYFRGITTWGKQERKGFKSKKK